MKTTKTIWALGDAVVDLLPVDQMQFQACAGGAPANVAIGAAKLGQQSGFIGKVGHDYFGSFMEKTFLDHGVKISSLQKDPHYKTSTVLVALDDKGERTFSFLVSPSADQFLTEEAIPDFSQHDIFHVCSLAFVGEDCFKTTLNATQKIKEKGGLVSFDINLREQMWDDKTLMRKRIAEYCKEADILKLSEEELYWLAESANWNDAINGLKTYYSVPLTIITKGELGSVVLFQGQELHFNAYKVNCIDTTGAGDAFISGLLSYLAEYEMVKTKADIESMITQASICGALATIRKGAIPALPNREELQTFMHTHSVLTAH